MLLMLICCFCWLLCKTCADNQKQIEDSSEFMSEEITESNVSALSDFRNCTVEPFYQDGWYFNASCQITSFAALLTLPSNTLRLYFNGNNITVFKRAPFRKFSLLEYLNISNNKIKTVKRSGLKGLGKLKTLILSNNAIETLSGTVFLHCSMLEDIDLSFNKLYALQTVTSAMLHLTRLRRLSFYQNQQIKIINENDFNSISKSLTYMNLGHCELNIISPGAFSHLENLGHLVLSENPAIREHHLENAMINVTEKIEILELADMKLNKIPTTLLQRFSEGNIKYLNLHSNYFSGSYGHFPFLPSLLRLNLKNCHITSMDEKLFTNLTSLQELDLSRNRFTFLMPAIYHATSLKTLDLSDNKNYYAINDDRFDIGEKLFVNMTSLRTLILDNLDLHQINRHALYGLKNLENLFIRKSLSRIDEFAFDSLQNLKLLNISTNTIKTLSNNVLSGAVTLTSLIVTDNQITLSDCQDICFSHQTPNLRKLDLSRNKINQIPVKDLSLLPRLEELSLSDNNIIPWTKPGVFGKQPELRTLDLRGNNLNSITQAMRSDFESLHQLDVSKNPFNCSSCQVHEFIHWIISTNTTKLKNANNLICATPDEMLGHLLLDLSNFPPHCIHEIMSHSIATVLGVSLTLVLLIVISGVCYRYRWYIRYYWFISRSRLRKMKNSNEDSDYRYDAFISYNINDRSWLVERLLPNLEQNEPKLTLCLHERDFEIGREIWNNIVDSIDSSRKVVLLLSNNFLSSQWCTWEMNMAQFKLVDDAREALVLILLEKLDKKNLTSTLRYLIRTRTYLEWTDNIQGQKIFWERLKRALQKPYTTNQQTLV